jgi:hypothetical protein
VTKNFRGAARKSYGRLLLDDQAQETGPALFMVNSVSTNDFRVLLSASTRHSASRRLVNWRACNEILKNSSRAAAQTALEVGRRGPERAPG